MQAATTIGNHEASAVFVFHVTSFGSEALRLRGEAVVEIEVQPMTENHEPMTSEILFT